MGKEVVKKKACDIKDDEIFITNKTGKKFNGITIENKKASNLSENNKIKNEPVCISFVRSSD